MTNEEWLCQLSTKEKAQVLNGETCRLCTFNNRQCLNIGTRCLTGILEWLKQERSEE